MAIGEQTDQAIGGNHHGNQIQPATAAITPDQLAGLQCWLLGQLREGGYIAPAKVETLSSDRMTTVGCFTAQQDGAATQSWCQTPLHGEPGWLIKQPFRLDRWRQGLVEVGQKRFLR